MIKNLKILLVLILSTTSCFSQKNALVYPNTTICSKNIKVDGVACVENTFYILKGENITPVKKENLDPLLRKMNSKIFSKFLKNGYVRVTKDNKNNYNITSHIRLEGGGVGGANAGYWIGRIGTHLVFHGAVIAISGGVTLVAGPGAGATVLISLEKSCGPVVEGVSRVAAIGGAIIGGTTTGPV